MKIPYFKKPNKYFNNLFNIIFSFAKKLGLNEKNTLFLFGDFYRKDVLGDLQGTNHQNIRNFMKTGWEGINFRRESLIEK